LRGFKTLVLAAAITAMAATPALARKKKEQPPPPAQQTAAQPARPAVPDIAARARELIDQEAEAVRARYGEPRLLRKEPPAQIWQYADDTCVLLVVLYDPKDGKGAPKVKYAQGRMLPGRESQAAACLTGPRSSAAPNASAAPQAAPAPMRAGGPLSGTPVYSPGDPVPPQR